LGALLAAAITAPTALAAAGQHPERCGVSFPGHAPAPWPSMRRDPQNTGLGTIHAVYHGDRPWSFKTGAGLFITPVVAGNGLIYFGSADHNFYALTPRGNLCWKLRTGNIIDAAAALGPSQRTVTIGSADDHLYHLSTNPAARRRVIWRFKATKKPVTGQLVNWWEDDIAFGPDRNIFTGNTGGLIYSFTPSGRLRWTFTAGNSVWTMPAFGAHGRTFWGSVDRNIYALDAQGKKLWSTPTLGFVISSPAIGSDGTVYIGSFDSKLYALNPSTGVPDWTFGTNDNIYSSPALAHNSHGQTDAIYFASTDGSVYALTPGGKLMWSYDTGEPIRSSPVLGPGPPGDPHDILYVGSSDGSLYALDASTGKRRWSFNTIDYGNRILRDRHELNSSPALGRTGVYIGSEDGHLWYVPYDYCLHHSDPRCDTDPGTPYPARITRVLPVSSGGTTVRGGSETGLPASTEITGRLIVRRPGVGRPLVEQRGQTVYAAMLPAPSAASLVHTRPAFRFSTQLSGDGRFVFIKPDSFLRPSTTYHVDVAGRWGADGTRVANYTTPGTWTRYGRFGNTFSFTTAPLGGPLPLHVTGNHVTVFRLRRMAVPLPSFLTSVNQIGFDSYVLLVGAVSMSRPDASGRGRVLLWATQARQGPGGTYVPDPHGTLVFPLAGYYRGSTLMLSVHGVTLTFSFGKVPLQFLDMDLGLTPSLHNQPGASLYAQTVCAQIPNYGPAAYLTGLCNTNGLLATEGTFITDPYHFQAPPQAHLGAVNVRPRGVTVKSVVLQRPTGATGGSVTAHLALARGASYPAALHRVGLLLVTPSGQPLGIDYTATTAFKNRAGSITGMRLAIPRGTVMPAHLTAYVMADVFPLAHRSLY
jgi:outer membrane protein assembly factor BamB